MYISYTTQRRCRCTYSVDTYSTCPLEELCRIPCASVQRKRGTLSAKNQNYAFFRVTYFLTWQFINNDYCNSSERRGALRGTTTFSKLGVQFLGLGYYTEQNTDGIPSFVPCSLRKKVRVVRPNFGVSGSPNPTVVGGTITTWRQQYYLCYPGIQFHPLFLTFQFQTISKESISQSSSKVQHTENKATKNRKKCSTYTTKEHDILYTGLSEIPTYYDYNRHFSCLHRGLLDILSTKQLKQLCVDIHERNLGIGRQTMDHKKVVKFSKVRY